jgi:predicted chitinase
MLNQAMDEQGITDPSLRAGIAAVNEGESGFKPRTESDYSTTSNARLRSIFSTATGGMSDDALSKLKGDPRAFFNKIYGGNAALGNQGGDDGYNYRGRGLNQLTGRANYKKYGDKIGVDLLSNPDLANDPKVAASLSVAYMKDRYKGGGFAGMKAAVGNSIGAPNAVKDQAYAAYMQSGQFSGMRPDPSLATGASARMAGNQAGGSSTEVHIASVTVNTRATDAAGVAKDFHAEVRKQYAYASQANYGLA